MKSTRTGEVLQPGTGARRAERVAITLLPRLAGWLGVGALATSLLAIILWWEAAQSGFLGAVPLGPLMLGLALGFGMCAALLRFAIAPSLERPAAEIAAVAEAVAAGNLTVQALDERGGGHLPRLRRAVARMVVSLRRLAGAIRGASHETAALAEQITASSEHMAERAQHMAQTSSALTGRVHDMAGVVNDVANDAHRLDEIASDLSSGARAGAARNRELRALAAENRERLDTGAGALTRLESEVHETAQAVEALVEASEEIRAFVTLVQKMARQSRLLSLNAAMEAARAGEHGDGFAVVAAEVRRLATMSNDAAVRTENTVTAVLERLETSRVNTERAVGTVDEVLAATSQASESFSRVEQAVEQADELMSALEEASVATTSLAGGMSTRLAQVSLGTRELASAMREMATASEEQSASTQEVAAAAGTLTRSAEHLASLVDTFQLDSAPGDRRQQGSTRAGEGAGSAGEQSGAGTSRPGSRAVAGTQSIATHPALSPSTLTSA
ncbi:MAG TPA: methyl-accepting chemotaxis protein [Gemmatimonadales bacterium]|nr:methyl-accepting chemotaxis protein [Gemmatimonadales bacterium]